MPADAYARPARFVERAGIAYLFGGAQALEFPNLHAEITGREGIEEWDEDTELVWSCRGELPRRGLAWYGEWLRGRGTFVARRMLPAALGLTGRTTEEEAELGAARRLGGESALLYEVLLTEGPLATRELREAAGFLDRAESRRFKRALQALQRALLVTQFGSKVEGGSWASAVFEPTLRAFPEVEPLPREEALGQLLSVYRRWADRPDSSGAARLFGVRVDEVRLLEQAGVRPGGAQDSRS